MSAPAPDPDRGGADANSDTLVVFNAGSLALPFKTLLDSFSVREHVTVYQENAGSLETARRIIDLNRTPDVVALADAEVFPRLLMPTHVTWYAKFARSRLVITYTTHSSGAAEITLMSWWRILLRRGVEVGRSDPDRDPAGYRTLLIFQLAERFYKRPGLAATLLAAAPPRNMRPKSADLTLLVELVYTDATRATGAPADRTV
jgi:molybdate/tungstate transport system substrate-binding protein